MKSKKKNRPGRFIADEYTIFLTVVAVLLMAIGVLTSSKKYFGVILLFIAVFFIIKAFIRLMSKNSEKCIRRNKEYLRQKNAIVNALFVKPFRTLREGKNYKFFICPECSALLRLPKREGHIEIKCPKCEHKFIRKT